MSAAASGLRVQQRIGWRWIKFNLVGGIGIGVQLATLWILLRGFHCNYLVATTLAVETAVLHNFLWHQRFTWADRVPGRTTEKISGQWRGSALRLLQFNLSNGVVSVCGNLLLMRGLVGDLHMSIVPANLLSIAICSLANFLLGEMYVFRARRA